MATLLAVGALASAAAAGYGAYQGGQAQKAANRSNAQTIAENRRVNTANALQDAINSYQNQRQQAIDNGRYDEAKRIEDAQRQLVNSLATATQTDADGNTVEFDRLTGTWRQINRGVGAVNADRRRTLTGIQGQQALDSAVVGGGQARDRMLANGPQQSTERALSAELLNRYRQSQGRSPEQIQGAMIEKNVADVSDPLRSRGESAMLAGYRQGNSGNDALMGSLARAGGAGTRSAIASARLGAPAEAYNERSAAASSILGPSTTLGSRGYANPGNPSPVFGGDASANLMASIARGQAAGVGTTLNPRSGGQLAVQGRPGMNTGFSPMNATGNMAASMSGAMNSLLTDPNIRALFAGSSNRTPSYENANKPFTPDPGVQVFR